MPHITAAVAEPEPQPVSSPAVGIHPCPTRWTGLVPTPGQRSSWLKRSVSAYSQGHKAERCSPQAQSKMPWTEVDVNACSILLLCGPGLLTSLHMLPGPHHLRGGGSMPKHCLEQWTETAKELKIIWERTVLSFKWGWLFIQEIVDQVESCKEPFSALPFSIVIWMEKCPNSDKNSWILPNPV